MNFSDGANPRRLERFCSRTVRFLSALSLDAYYPHTELFFICFFFQRNWARGHTGFMIIRGIPSSKSCDVDLPSSRRWTTCIKPNGLALRSVPTMALKQLSWASKSSLAKILRKLFSVSVLPPSCFSYVSRDINGRHAGNTYFASASSSFESFNGTPKICTGVICKGN